MIYNIHDKPPFGKAVIFALQMVLSVFVATLLIANICGVSTSGGLIAPCFATLIYLFITKADSPMFLSNSGAFVTPVMFALATCGYTGVAIGGLTSCVVYCIFGLIFTKIPYQSIYKIFPPALIGAVTCVIGITLMGFIPTYIGDTGMWGMIIAFITMASVALISHYAKGIAKILPFLLGILIGYGAAAILTLAGICSLIDFSIFNNMKIIAAPDLACFHWDFKNLNGVWSIVILYIAYTISAMMEALSDHAALGGIIGVDLYKKPGLSRIFIGEGVGNLVSACLGGLGSCSYGESVATIGFSRVASVFVTMLAALILGILAYLAPLQIFIASIPSCVFAGCAIILYGFIACSGVKMLQKTDLNVQKNLIIVSSVMSIGISGIAFGGAQFSLSGTALALIVGVILNLVLRERKI